MFPSAAEIKNFGFVGVIARKIRDIFFVVIAILSGSLGEALFPTEVKRVRHCAMGFVGRLEGGQMFQNSSDDICEFSCYREFLMKRTHFTTMTRVEAMHKNQSIRMQPDRTHRRWLWRSLWAERQLKFAEALYPIPPLGACFTSGM